MARTQGGLTKVLVKLNGKTYRSSSGVEMNTANYIDAYAELLKNNGGIGSLVTNSISETRYSLDMGAVAPTTLAFSGSYFYELNFENSYDTNASSSGEQINHNNLELHLEFAAAPVGGLTFDVFLEYEQEYHLNRSTRVWEIMDVTKEQN